METDVRLRVSQILLSTQMHRVIRTQDLSDDHCQYLYATRAGCVADGTAFTRRCVRSKLCTLQM